MDFHMHYQDFPMSFIFLEAENLITEEVVAYIDYL